MKKSIVDNIGQEVRFNLGTNRYHTPHRGKIVRTDGEEMVRVRLEDGKYLWFHESWLKNVRRV